MTKTWLDAVELRWISNVQDLYNIELIIEVLHFMFIRMNTELIHQYRKRFISVQFSQYMQVICKIFSIYGSIKYIKSLESMFWRNTHYCTYITRVYTLLVYRLTSSFAKPIFRLKWSFRKDDFIQVYLLSCLTLCFLKLLKQLLSFHIKYLLNMRRFEFLLFHSLTFNLVWKIKATKRSDRYSFVRKLSMKQHGFFLESFTRPKL